MDSDQGTLADDGGSGSLGDSDGQKASLDEHTSSGPFDLSDAASFAETQHRGSFSDQPIPREPLCDAEVPIREEIGRSPSSLNNLLPPADLVDASLAHSCISFDPDSLDAPAMAPSQRVRTAPQHPWPLMSHSEPDKPLLASASLNTTPRVDVHGRPLPSAPPPQDPFACAVAQQPSLVKARQQPTVRSRFGSVMASRFGSRSAGEDDTQSSWGSTSYATELETTDNVTRSIHEAAQATEQARRHEEGDGAASRSTGALPAAAASQSLRRSSTEPADLAKLAAGCAPTFAQLCVDLPALPSPSYHSPHRAASIDSHSSSNSSAHILWATRQPIHGSPIPESARPTLAVRRSAQELPPLLPTAHTPAAPYLVPPASHSSPLVSSLSLSSLPFPPIDRGKDGFYRLPVSPSKIRGAGRGGGSPFEDATNLSFPLPPDSESKIAALQSAAGSSYHGSRGSPVTPVTPSSSSHPSSPPPQSPPPPLPDFVSVFLQQQRPRFGDNSHTDYRDDNDEDLSSDAGEVAAYPPSPRPGSHVRQAGSISSAVAPQVSMTQALRQRTHTLSERAGATPMKQERTTAWLEKVSTPGEKVDFSPSGEKVRWAANVAPGWSLCSDRRAWPDAAPVQGPSSPGNGNWRMRFRSRKMRIAIAVLIVVVLLLIVGLATGLTHRAAAAAQTLANCDCLNGGKAVLTPSGDCVCHCKGDWGGTSCHLDGTCVNGLAQGMVDTAARASELWEPPINTTRLATSLSRYFLPPNDADTTSCAAQLAAVSLSDTSFSTYPNHINWIEAALLYTFAQTESNSTLAQFRLFASRLDFRPFGDEPASKPNSNYAILSAGYTWDLAVMQRSVQPLSWNDTVGASASSVTVDATSTRALDLITSNAVAASRQRSTALMHYWNDTLGLAPSQLDAFRAAVQNAEVLVPFDASGISAASYADTASLPPRFACSSAMGPVARERLTGLEAGVFGFPMVGNATSDCATRPLYGIVNLLNLRLPFASSDTRTSLPQQALVISPSSSLIARTSVHAGEILAAGPLAPPPTMPSAPTTIERFGLVAPSIAPALDHVLLDYLILLSVPVAQALVAYLLSSPSPTAPLPSSSILVQQPLPIIEAQMWGPVEFAQDIAFVRSGLGNPAGSNASGLFFGSSDGVAFRSWALGKQQGTVDAPVDRRIEWAPTADSENIVSDTGQAGLDSVWAQAGQKGLDATQVWAALTAQGVT
ncbi:hypothetical protein JCM10908_003798 [Rhodotorula pacifica]|uniref:uncharacterized protein n=1 Tax=Rhodotorula pacifica TaxID=1495444 RepID=UPI003179CF43